MLPVHLDIATKLIFVIVCDIQGYKGNVKASLPTFLLLTYEARVAYQVKSGSSVELILDVISELI